MFWARSLCTRTITESEADAHMGEWGVIVDQVGIDALERAVMEVVRNDSDFFPALSKIRHRAGMNADECVQVEGSAAWEFVRKYVRHHWTPDLGACSFLGKPAPKIPPRTEYALRQIGGLKALFYMEQSAEPFKRRDFLEAYRMAPVEERMRPQLESQFAPKELSAGMKQLMSGKAMNIEPKPAPVPVPAKAVAKMPEAPLSAEQWEQRQAELRKQVDQLREAK